MIYDVYMNISSTLEQRLLQCNNSC